MNRKQFLTHSLSLLGGACILGKESFFRVNDTYSTEELIGKEKIILHGMGYQLRKEASDAFLAMKNAAKKDGVNLYSISSYRSYAHQNSIWTKKYKRFIQQGLQPKAAIDKIILYSTIPGTSRHHWGTDLDIIDSTKGIPPNPLNEKLFKKNAIFYPFKQWMNEYAASFGFYEVYTNEETRKGFNYEPWHFSYKPLAAPMLNAYKKLPIKSILQENQLIGSQYFTDSFIDTYINNNILDINPQLL